MKNVQLTVSDIIQLVGIIATSLTSIVAIVISVISLRQNSKMIKESSRGYITVYTGTTYWSTLNNYLIIKNFGNSSATIIDFNVDYDLSKFSYAEGHIPFYKIIGTTLAPNESIKYSVTLNDRPKDLSTINISLKYITLNETYSENVTINFDAQCNVVYLRANPNDALKGISHALQDISEKML